MSSGVIDRPTSHPTRTLDEWSAPPATRRTSAPRADRHAWWSIVVAASVAVGFVTVLEKVGPEPATSVPVSEDTDATGAASLAVVGGRLDLDATGATIAFDNVAPMQLTTTRVGEIPFGGGAIEQRDGEVARVTPEIEEWYREAGAGFEHGYTIAEPVSGDELVIDIAITGGAPLSTSVTSAAITMPDDTTLWYRDLYVFDAAGHTLPATMTVEQSTIRLTVDVPAARYPITVDPVITPTQMFGGQTGDRLGTTVAVDGNRMAIGAPGRVIPDGGGPGVDTTGVVYMYERSGPGATWEPDGVVVNPGTGYTEYGTAIALAGDRLAVGAPGLSLTGPDQGVVFRYDRTGPGTWSTAGTWQAPTSGADSYGFGYSLDFADDGYLVIGAPGLEGGVAMNAGQVFELAGGVVSDLGVGVYALGVGSEVGHAVAVDTIPGGYRLVVGMPGDEGGMGHMRVLDNTGSGYVSRTGSSGAGAGSRLGSAVDVDGDRVVYNNGDNVSIISSPDGGLTWPAAEFVLFLPRGSYPAANQFIDLDGGVLAVGDIDDSKVEIFRHDGTSWGATSVGAYTLIPPGTAPGDDVGFAVALDGPTLVVGAPSQDVDGGASPEAGAAYIVQIPVVSTFIGGPGALWSSQANWDTGVVPGTNDTAIVPSGAGAAIVQGSATVGRLVTSRTIDVIPGSSLTIAGSTDGPSHVQSGGTIIVRDDALLRLSGNLTVANGGTMSSAAPGEFTPSTIQVAAGVTIDGDGTVNNNGRVQVTGTGTAVIGGTLVWNNGSSSLVEVIGGIGGSNLDIDTSAFDTETNYVIGRDSTIWFADDVRLGASSQVTITVDVNSGAAGRMVLEAGSLYQRGALVLNPVNGTNPSAHSPYTLFECLGGSCAIDEGGEGFTTLGTSSFLNPVLDIVTTQESVVAKVLPNKISGPGGGSGAHVDIQGDVAVAMADAPPYLTLVLRRHADTRVWSNTETLLSGPLPPPDGGPAVGNDVALDGTLLVTAGGNGVTTYTDSGAGYTSPAIRGVNVPSVDIADSHLVYVVGTQVQIDPVGGGPLMFFDPSVPVGSELGASVAFGGDVAGGEGFIVVGTPGATPGQVLVWEQDEGDWGIPSSEPPIVLTTPEGSSSEFGRSVATDGTRIVVGDPGADGSVGGITDAGLAWVYDSPFDTSPDRLWAPDELDGNAFGSSVAIDGDVVAVGAPAAAKLPGAFYRDGAAYVFSPSTGTTTFRAEDGEDGEQFGASVAVDGGQLIVGAPGDRNAFGNVGAVYLFDLDAEPEPDPDPDDPQLASLDINATTSVVSLASTGVPTSLASRGVLDGREPGHGSIASTPIASIDLTTPIGGVQSTPLASITIEESILAALGTTSPIDRLPLTAIELHYVVDESANPPTTGGWEELLAAIAAARPGNVTAQALTTRPPQNIAFGEVRGYEEVKQLRLTELSLAGTPLASIPLASIALGATPLASIGTGGAIDWCAQIAAAGSSASCGEGETIDPATTTLVALALMGVPLASIPLASIPLASINVADTPLASIPLASIDLAGTPLASIPLASIELAGTPLASIPLASIPLASIPLASIPLASIELVGTPLASIPLASIDVGSTPLASIPLASIDVGSTPLASIPLASIPLASIPLASIPLASIQVGSTPLASIPLASIAPDGTPLASIPLASIPLASINVGSTPLASIPLASIPLASIPLASIPLASIAPAGTPLASIPLASIDPVGTPLASIPLASIPLASIESVVNCGVVDCTSRRLSLADALAQAPRAGATFADLAPLLGGFRVGDVLPMLGIDAEAFATALAAASLTLGSVVADSALGFDDWTLAELPASVLQLLQLGHVAPNVPSATLGDLMASLGWSASQVQAALQQLQGSGPGGEFTLADMTAYGNLILGDLDDLGGLQLGQLGQALGDIRLADVLTVLGFPNESQAQAALLAALAGLTLAELDDAEGVTLGELLGVEQFGELTIGQLIAALDADALDGVTLGDLLLALIVPSDYPWETVRFAEVDTTALPGVVTEVTFEVAFDIGGTTRTQQVEVTVAAPPTTGYIAGSSHLNGSSVADPVRVGDQLVWKLSGIASTGIHELTFDLQPALTLGTSTIETTSRIIGVPGTRTASEVLNVQQAFEVNDTPAQATAVTEETLYLTHITPGDVDYFRIDVEEGDRLVANLSNLDADFDLIVYGRTSASTITPLVPPSGQSAGTPHTDPAVGVDGSRTASAGLGDEILLAAGIPVVAAGTRRGAVSETVVTPPLAAGTVYLQVVGANGASSTTPLVLQVTTTSGTAAPACPAISLPSTTETVGQTAVPGDANTLILVNQQRLARLYPGSYEQVLDAVDLLVDYLLGSGVGLGIVPGVVAVDGLPTIQAAYAAWDQNPCNPGLANAVASTITTEIGRIRESHDIEHIMIVGGDDVIPMARVADATTVANEYDYRYAFGGNNALAGAAWASQILSDEPYGETTALSVGDRFLYVTDAALGRLVETPEEIERQIDEFISSNGSLAPQTALVVGYDFLDDGSEAIAASLDAAGLDVDDEYGTSADGDMWTADDLTDKLFPPSGAASPDIISLNAHFDHRRALPAYGNTTGSEDDLFMAQTVLANAPGALEGRVTFSMGCHSGLNVSAATIPVGALAQDFPQAFAGIGGIYVGNTGYGYGDTEIVAYSERLMELFSSKLVRPVRLDPSAPVTTAGQALKFAKNSFYSELGENLSVYDEKALMEATFYGVPFFRIGSVAPVPPTVVPAREVGPQGSIVFPGISPNHELDETPADGAYYLNRLEDGTAMTTKAPYAPVQPLELIDVSVVEQDDRTQLAKVAHGAFVLDMTSTYHALDPLIVKPVVDHSDLAPEPVIDEIHFPAKPLVVRTSEQPEGTRQSVALTTGKFGGSSTAGVQRLDDEILIEVFYAESDETDFDPPTFTEVSALVTGGHVVLSADVIDGGLTDGSGVERVYALVARSPGTATDWQGIDLTHTGGTRWTASVPLDSVDEVVEVIVQARDAAGNVGVATNKGVHYTGQVVTGPGDPGDPDALAVDIAPGPDVSEASGAYSGPITVTASGGDPLLPLTYRLGSEPDQPVPAGGIEITESTTLTLTRGAQTLTVPIVIDSEAPVVAISAPSGGNTPVGGSLAAVFSCADATLESCTGVVTNASGSAVRTGLVSGDQIGDLPAGTYTLTVTGVDRFDRTATEAVTFSQMNGWSTTAIYNTGDVVLYDGRVFLATWWTSGETPGSTNYGAWQEIAPPDQDGVAAWTSSRIYNTGDRVHHGGKLWTAQWWTRGDVPGASNNGPWQEIAPPDESGVAAWTATTVYNTGDQVSYQGQVWKAQWWTRGDAPGAPWGPWTLIG